MPPTGEMALALVIAVTSLILLFITASYLYWQRRLETAPEVPSRRCRFLPHRVRLHGTQGELLQAVVETEGPPGAVFATFVEEPWVVVAPSSGMFPQSVEILVYSTHAPAPGKHRVTVRLLPIEGEANAGVLELVVKLKPDRNVAVRSSNF